MKIIQCFYCGKKEKHEFDDDNCCFACSKLSAKKRYDIWGKRRDERAKKCEEIVEKRTLIIK